MSHIAFPVTSVTLCDTINEEGSVSLDRVAIPRSKWKFISQYMGSGRKTTIPFEEQIYDNFALKPTKRLRDTRQGVVAFEGYDSGFNMSFFFVFRQGQWMLVRMEDLTD